MQPSAADPGFFYCTRGSSGLPPFCPVTVAVNVTGSSFARQLGQLPGLSSGSGVVLTLDRTLGVYVASENLGPILTDRAVTIGKHKLLVAFAYQVWEG